MDEHAMAFFLFFVICRRFISDPYEFFVKNSDYYYSALKILKIMM